MGFFRKSTDKKTTAEFKAMDDPGQTGEFVAPKPSKKKQKETTTKEPKKPKKPKKVTAARAFWQAIGLAFRVILLVVLILAFAVTGTFGVMWDHWRGNSRQVDAFCSVQPSSTKATCSFRNRGTSNALRCVFFDFQNSTSSQQRQKLCSRLLVPGQSQSLTKTFLVKGGCGKGCRVMTKTGYTWSRKRGLREMLKFAGNSFLQSIRSMEKRTSRKQSRKKRR